MNDHIRGFIHTQNGYSKIEEGTLSPTYFKPESEDFNVKSSCSAARWVEIAWRCISIFIFICGGVMLLVAYRWQPSDKECTAQLSIWSPLFDAVEYEQRDWTSGLSASEFSGPPTPELEAKWSEITNSGTVLLSPERISSLNRSVEQGFVEATVDSISGFIAEIEVFHHLHCLNFVRQYIWLDFYPVGQIPSLMTQGKIEVNRLHATHCIEVLRQALTCNADLTPYLLYKTPNAESPVTEDFNANHKCKRFDLIMDWMKENSAAGGWAAVRKEYFGHHP